MMTYLMHYGLTTHEDGLSPIEAIDCAVDDAWYDVEGLEELWRTNA
jgi:hypothetical protein